MSIADRIKATETSVRAMAARLDALEKRQAETEQAMADLTEALMDDGEQAPAGIALDGTPIGGERDETQPL